MKSLRLGCVLAPRLLLQIVVGLLPRSHHYHLPHTSATFALVSVRDAMRTSMASHVAIRRSGASVINMRV